MRLWALALFAFTVSMLLVFPRVSFALDGEEESAGGTKAYEIEVQWKNQPEQVTSGLDVLSMIWWMDINDSAPAPGNEPTTDNLLVVTVENAHFGEIPSQCLSGDAGKSALSEDARTLTCDIGTRDQGTAQMVLSGVEVDGPAGSNVKAKAQFRGLEATLPEIPIIAPFIMDAKFDGGGPSSLTAVDPNFQDLNFPFSLVHSAGSSKGPSEVSYDITINGVRNERVTLQDVACAPIDRVHSGYPYSTDGFPANQTARFPTCKFELVDPDTNTFRLTLSDLDYSGDRPYFDSNGVRLPQVKPNYPNSVIAAGELRVKVPYVRSGNNANDNTNVTLKASTPTYVAADGSESVEDASNNQNRAPIVRGNWTGAWVVASQYPKAYPGIGWSDTSRAPKGATVMSVSGIVPQRTEAAADAWVCNTLDTERVDFVDARVVADVDAKPNVYYGDPVEELKILYYTGEVKDPNLFECGTVETRRDEGTDEKDGWTYTRPADLSTVKAVKVRVSRENGYLSSLPQSFFYLVVEQRIHDDVQIGDDVWTWTSVPWTGIYDAGWELDLPAKRYYDRTTFEDGDVIDAQYASPGVLTDGVRYPYTGPGRDLLRVVGSLPVVAKDVAQPEYGPGDEADYTIRFGLESEIANMPNDTVVIEDTLAPGMTYVEGSAATEPTVSKDAEGRQVLTWTVEDVVPNIDVLKNNPYTINYKATMPKDAKAGAVFTNTVVASSQGNSRRAEVKVAVPRAGYTSIKKHVEKPVVDTLTNGVAANTWTIDLTSKDPEKSTVTDVIDVLPYDGDDKGSKFSGTLVVKGVEAGEGATVYSTTAEAFTIDEDPNAKVNGKTGEPSDMWTKGVQENATAIRVVTKADFPYGDTQTITVKTELKDAKSGDVVVNKAVGRADHTKMRMRTSAQFVVLTPVELTVKKVWKDAEGEALTDTPDAVKVQLMRTQGEKIEPVGEKVELSAENDWKYTFTKLPAMVDGEPVSYTIAEDEVEDFTSEVAVDKVGENYSVIVTNTAEPDPTPDPTPTPTPTPKPDKPLPLTGAQTSALIVVAAGAMALGVTFLRYARRR